MDDLSHCTKNSRWKLQGRSATSVLIILVALSLLGWVYLTQASYVATTSRRVQKLEAEKARIEQENLQLMAEIAALESVSRLAVRAKELGFVLPSVADAEYLAVADTPAMSAHRPDANSPVAHWWDNVTSQFTAWARVGSP
jgi:cell division protein FtsB